MLLLTWQIILMTSSHSELQNLIKIGLNYSAELISQVVIIDIQIKGI
jgi:hypothetical protein